MLTSEILARYANDNNFYQYKRTLDTHLQGPRGENTLPITVSIFFSRYLPMFFSRFARNVAPFDPASIKLGSSPSCPYPLRQQIIAQHNYLYPSTNDCIRMTNLIAATLGVPLSLSFRIVRAVFRTLFAPVTLFYALYQQYRYGVKNWVGEDLTRISWEWIDVLIIPPLFFSGLINTLHPNAINLDTLRDYYVLRTDYAIARNRQFASAQHQYAANLAALSGA